MTTVLFVHGTGTRRPAFSETFDLVERSLHGIQQDLKVAPCFWGETLGSQLHAGGASIPLYDSARGVGDDEDGITEGDYLIALWEQLYRHPRYELRLLATVSEQSIRDFAPGQSLPGKELDDRFKAVVKAPPPLLLDLLNRAGIADAFNDAGEIVTRTMAYRQAIRAFSNTPEQGLYCTVIARAIIATAMALCQERQQYAQISLDAALRDTVIESFVEELGVNAQTRSVAGLVARKLFKLAVAIGAMDHVQRKRGAITDATYPFTGDILLYQGRGDAIRSFIRQCVKREEAPVVLLAHSLGGIACVDLLIMEALPEVKLLITVGSQAPFLYEINALHSLRYGNPLPSHFPGWLNIYDLRDFLSYIGAGVFEKVQDMPVDNKQSFPQSHIAYWTNPATWNIIAERLSRETLI